ncbi:centrosomal protein of 97 kDa-like [Teleopsis dalmanni]|uniref:centrosomal protein of 97 kDa-like n=1 Tax=Teleopsis dalmanni TaxID=139649 RepID=UPI0018CDBC87|nr:centrosomal protein of 97 kDa-like [Teleopsis dalmanni]XP_037938451.1 centrosomal protein of 97 kDa-like [Teleopsis dalmanni]
MSGKKLYASLLAEMRSRCHPKQKDEFMKFLKMHDGYKQRVDRFPEFLPKIDWDYFRRNVRKSQIPMVDDFEKQYVELNKMFNSRHELDTSRYYESLKKQEEEVQQEICKFKEESDKRIKGIEDEHKRISNLKPYRDMTMEEFQIARPDYPIFITSDGRPSFWPHTKEEQSLEPPETHIADDDAKQEKQKPQDPDSSDPSKKVPPKKADKPADPSKPTSSVLHGSECNCPKCTAKRKLRLVKDEQQPAKTSKTVAPKEQTDTKKAPTPENVKPNPAKTSREEAAKKLRLIKTDEKDDKKSDDEKTKKDETAKKPDNDGDDKKPK